MLAETDLVTPSQVLFKMIGDEEKNRELEFKKTPI